MPLPDYPLPAIGQQSQMNHPSNHHRLLPIQKELMPPSIPYQAFQKQELVFPDFGMKGVLWIALSFLTQGAWLKNDLTLFTTCSICSGVIPGQMGRLNTFLARFSVIG